MNKLSFNIGKLLLPVSFIIFGSAISIGAVKYKIGNISYPGAGFFPFVIGIGLVILGIIEAGISMNIQHKNEIEEEKSNFKVLLLLLIFIAFPILLDYIGYAMTTFLFIFFTAKIFDLEGIAKPGLLSFGTTVAVYILFKVCFYLDLPDGILIDFFLN